MQKCSEHLTWVYLECTSAAGAEPYEYQSCTHQHDGKGSMEGSFEFVEGTLSNPTGGFFDVEASVHQMLVEAVMCSC